MLFKDLCAVGRIPLLREAGKVAEGRMGCGKQDWYDEPRNGSCKPINCITN